MSNKLCVICPIALAESVEWRRHTNENQELRITAMLRSFRLGFDLSDLQEFLIVCPASDTTRIKELLIRVTDDRRFTVVDESALLGLANIGADRASELPSWHLQQVLKLAYARVCPAEFYLTMDSDIVLVRCCGLDDFVTADRKCITGTESIDDYRRLYVPSFADQEESVKRGYCEASQMVLGYRRPSRMSGRYFSETPVVLNTRCVTEALDYLESRAGGDLIARLCEFPGWTEYTLYFQYLEKKGTLEEFHILSHCNSVLLLERSVWQPTGLYKFERSYDDEHFFGYLENHQGAFVAIQSWISAEEWLPERYNCILDFYRDLNSWIDMYLAK